MTETVTTGGTRPRPRAAFLGEIPEEDMERYAVLFPTIWSAQSVEDLDGQTDRRETDVLIVYPGVSGLGWWAEFVHVICFSENVLSLPGPIPVSKVKREVVVEGAEFELPRLPIEFDRQRKADLSGLSTVRGWEELELDFNPNLSLEVGSTETKREASRVLSEGALILERHGRAPLASVFMRSNEALGIAWLPNARFDRVAWVELVCRQWADADKESFPDFCDWTLSSDWLVDEETTLTASIAEAEAERESVLAELDSKVSKLHGALSDARHRANSGRRRLLTSQGEVLVEEVSKALREIGFIVTESDTETEESKPKLEDLELTLEDDSDWVALVEVRGYSKSGGKTADLARLQRFASHFAKEHGRPPNKLIYVCNGQIELPPSRRDQVLGPAAEDVAVFAEAPGLVISTIDLYRVIRNLDELDRAAVLLSIREGTGRWKA